MKRIGMGSNWLFQLRLYWISLHSTKSYIGFQIIIFTVSHLVIKSVLLDLPKLHLLCCFLLLFIRFWKDHYMGFNWWSRTMLCDIRETWGNSPTLLTPLNDYLYVTNQNYLQFLTFEGNSGAFSPSWWNFYSKSRSGLGTLCCCYRYPKQC